MPYRAVLEEVEKAYARADPRFRRCPSIKHGKIYGKRNEKIVSLACKYSRRRFMKKLNKLKLRLIRASGAAVA